MRRDNTLPAFFTSEEREKLAALCDRVFPKASALGAIDYIEALLTAFECDPPRIYADGPYSGRTPFSSLGAPTNDYPENSFLRFMPLNRVQTAAWKLRIYGSKTIEGGWWNESSLGPVVGLRDLFREGLEEGHLSSDLKNTLKELVLESCFAAPEYGGNANISGWKIAFFPGDALPLGYSLFDESSGIYQERPGFSVSTCDVSDPAPMGVLTRVFCWIVTMMQGGRVY